MKSIPNEVLADIFLCLTSETDWKADCTDVGRPPWSLSHVCGPWRSIVLRLPRLWTVITIPYGAEKKRKDVASLVQAYLERSGDRPLFITYEAPRPPVSQLITAQSHRWVSFAARLRKLGDHTHLEPARGRVPLLKNLELTAGWRDYDGRYGPLPTIDIFDIAPKLQIVRSDREIGYLIVPLQGLKRFGGLIQDPVTHYLGSAPRLKTLNVPYRVRTSPHPRPPPVPVRHDILSRLIVPSSKDLRLLTLPALGDLVINAVASCPFGDIVRLVQNSSCAIEHLNIKAIAEVIETNFISFCQSSPQLSSLFLSWCAGYYDLLETDAVINPLTVSPGDTVALLPNLTVLQLEFYAPYLEDDLDDDEDPEEPAVDHEALQKMLLSRCLAVQGPDEPTVARLECLTLFIPGIPGSDLHKVVPLIWGENPDLHPELQLYDM